MSAFDDIEEKILRKEKEIEAREIRARLREIESELDNIPVTPTYKHEETVAKKSRGFLQQISDIGKFVLIVFSVVVAIRVANWVGLAIMVISLVWISYKLFFDSKS